MPISTVEILCGNNPLHKNKVVKISVKLKKRTVKAGIRRHKEKPFDVVVCVEMEVILETCKLNKKEAETWRQKEKTRRERLNRDKKLEPIPCKERPPPCNTGLYPLILETLDIKGEVVMEDNGNKNRGLKLGQHIHIDCHKEIRKSQRENVVY